MHLRSLSLRNYRVYRELELEFPDGLCGIYGANGSGKCVTGDTRLFDADAGGMVPISQFVADQRKWTLGLRDGKIQPVEVTDWMTLGDRPTVEVTLKNGARLEVAETHPVLTDRGCVQAKDLTTEHWVAEAAVIPQLGPPRLTVDEAMLLGLLLGDGSLSSTGIVLTAADAEIADLYQQLIERLFPGATVGSVPTQSSARQFYVRNRATSAERRVRLDSLVRRLQAHDVPLERYVRRSNLVGVLRGTRGISWDALCAIEEDYGIDLFADRCALFAARAVLEWVRSFGMVGTTAGTKHIPDDCLTMPDAQTWALLAGLWLTDGWLVAGEGSSIEVGFCTKSDRLARDVRVLLTRLGLRSTIKPRKLHGNWYSYVHLSHGSIRALGPMPLVGRKARLRDHLIARPLPRRPGTSGDMIPPSFNSQISVWRLPSGANRGVKQRHHAMNRRIFRDFAGPGSVADDETTWSRVASVTPTGRSVPCYDIEVDTPEHLYLAETLVVHNSTLIEAIRYSIYGESRTAKDELRSADVREDLRATLVFEHEGNTYEVRRGLKGQALTPEARVFCNGQLAVSGVRDANAYLARVVGMRQDAFLASVCAQQKELTTFASMSPADRRRLVLDLLGVRPVEKALTLSRARARDARNEATGARRSLPNLEEREKAVAEAEAELLAATEALTAATGAESAAAGEVARCRQASAEAESAARQVEELRQAARLAEGEAASAEVSAAGHLQRAADGEQARQRLAASQARVDGLGGAQTALAELDGAREAQQARRAQQRTVDDAAARHAAAERSLAEARQATDGAAAAQTAVGEADAAVVVAVAALEEARTRWAAASGEVRAAEARREAAQTAAQAADSLQADAPCPTCGQVLGAAFAQVRAHRADELAAAGQQAADAAVALKVLEAEGETARRAHQERVKVLDAARETLTVRGRAAALAEHAEQTVGRAAAELTTAQTALDALPDPGYDPAAHQAARDLVAELHAEAARLETYRAQVAHAQSEADLAAQARVQAEAARGRAAEATEQAAGLAHLETAREQARVAEQAAGRAAQEAHGHRRGAEAAESGARRRLADHTAQLDEARAAHERVAVAEEQAAYADKASELLAGFRLHLVTRLGGRLTTEAARLFGELTDHTYADLVVDPEDYGIRIADGGIEHELTRFSGSENDLASLSLRVAISLVIADGARELGLLVLDEVLGSLDRERRERMLAALTALQGRFRQVLLVTHNDEVKDLLPAAIEVRQLAGRTSTARLL